MERQQDFESTGNQECGSEKSVRGSLDVAAIGVGVNVSCNGSTNSCSGFSNDSDSSLPDKGGVLVASQPLYFGDRSSSPGMSSTMSSTPQSSNGSPQVMDAVGAFCRCDAVDPVC